MHLVHQKTTDADSAVGGDSTGYQVVSLVFQMAGPNDAPNPYMDLIAQSLAQVIQPNSPVSTVLTSYLRIKLKFGIFCW